MTRGQRGEEKHTFSWMINIGNYHGLVLFVMGSDWTGGRLAWNGTEAESMGQLGHRRSLTIKYVLLKV